MRPPDEPPPCDDECGTARGLPPVLDVAAGLDLLQGNRAIYGRLVGRFRNAGRDLPQRLRAVQESGDLAELGRFAHNLKGTAGQLAAEPLRRAAAELEAAVRAGRADPRLVERLLAELERVLAALAALEL